MIKKEKKKGLDQNRKETEDENASEDLLEGTKKDLINKDLLLAQIKGLEDKLLRAQAEIQNVRRVASEEITRARLFGVDSLVREFLVVGDNIQMALKTCEDAAEIKAIREGLELTLKSFEDSLETSGVLPLDPDKENFDPEKHEAISVLEDNKKEPNTIVEVVQRGFTIQNRILRPAKVIVTKKTEKK